MLRGYAMQGERAEKRGHLGKEWWGKRPRIFHPVSTRSKTNKFFKRLLHKIERRLGKKVLEENKYGII